MLNNNFIDRKDFIRCYQGNGWMDLGEFWTIDSLHNEGTTVSAKLLSRKTFAITMQNGHSRENIHSCMLVDSCSRALIPCVAIDRLRSLYNLWCCP